jgi:hypothetical protein
MWRLLRGPMITTGYLWMLAEVYLKHVDKPATHSDEYNAKDHIFIPMHDDDPCKTNNGNDPVECAREEDHTHNKDDDKTH